MTTVKNAKTNEITELACIIDGVDILNDVMGGCGISREVEDADYILPNAEEVEWWENWARIEELVHEARKSADEATIAKHEQLISEGYDMESLHERECELYGIDC